MYNGAPYVNTVPPLLGILWIDIKSPGILFYLHLLIHTDEKHYA